MLRFLLLAVLLGLVWRSLERLAGGRAGRSSVPEERRTAGGEVERLVACAGCGVYRPASRMSIRGGEPFCSDDCFRGRRVEVS